MQQWPSLRNRRLGLRGQPFRPLCVGPLWSRPQCRKLSCCAGRRGAWWRQEREKRWRSSCSTLAQWSCECKKFVLKKRMLLEPLNFKYWGYPHWCKKKKKFDYSRRQRNIRCWNHKNAVGPYHGGRVACHHPQTEQELPWSRTSGAPNADCLIKQEEKCQKNPCTVQHNTIHPISGFGSFYMYYSINISPITLWLCWDFGGDTSSQLSAAHLHCWVRYQIYFFFLDQIKFWGTS